MVKHGFVAISYNEEWDEIEREYFPVLPLALHGIADIVEMLEVDEEVAMIELCTVELGKVDCLLFTLELDGLCIC